MKNMYLKRYLAWVIIITICIISQWKAAFSTYQLKYIIKINVDGSAYWIVEQKGIGLQLSFDTFCQKVKLVLEKAEEETSREMVAVGFSMSANLSGSYSIIKYMFRWKNFSVAGDSRIMIGDVFEVENFFNYLYGNGEVEVQYPLEYVVQSVSPNPHYEDPTIPMLVWYGIEDFKIGEPKMILIEKSSPSGLWETISNVWILILLAVSLIGGGFIGVYYFRHKKLKFKKPKELERLEVSLLPKVEDAEEKIVNLLRAAGGSMHQHKIAEECGFSRAKTSKLLRMMESKGKIKREQKGREKIVILLEER